jgi:hypothetical protein
LRNRKNTAVKVRVIESTTIKNGLAKIALIESSSDEPALPEYCLMKIAAIKYCCGEVAVLENHLFPIDIFQYLSLKLPSRYLGRDG